MIVVARLQAISGKEKEVEGALKDMIAKVEEEEGTQTYTLHRNQKDSTVFLFYEKYQDKAALDYHTKTPYFKELFATIGPLMSGEPIVETFDELGGIKNKTCCQ